MILQSVFFRETRTVIAAPFVPGVPFVPRLNPSMDVAGRSLALNLSEMAAIPRRALSESIVNLARERHRIIAALDILFTGI